MLTIYGRHTSSNVQKVLWACAEMGVPFERIDMAGKFGFTDEYLALNPNRVVPTIDDDGFVLWESNACVRYLADRHGSGTLAPADPRARADADRWMDWQQTTLWPPLRVTFHGLVRTAPADRDMTAIEEGARRAGALLAILDDRLATRDFVAGDTLTMGDIPVGGVVYRWYALDIARPDRPHVRAWYERLCARPGYAEHIMIPLE